MGYKHISNLIDLHVPTCVKHSFENLLNLKGKEFAYYVQL